MSFLEIDLPIILLCICFALSSAPAYAKLPDQDKLYDENTFQPQKSDMTQEEKQARIRDIQKEIRDDINKIKAMFGKSPDMDAIAIDQLSPEQIKEAERLWDRMNDLKRERISLEREQ